MELAQISMFAEPAVRKASARLRYYQQEAHDAVFEAWKTHRKLLLNMATGTGKTVVFAEIARNFKGRVLVLAHRDELVYQTLDQLVASTDEHIGLEQAGMYSQRERIVVGSVQTVTREDRIERLQKLGGFDLVILDETHHYVAKTYKRAFEAFPHARVLGVTATPDRGDKKALGQILEHCAYRFDILAAIDAGYLVPLEGHHVTIDEIDLSDVRTVCGDLAIGALDEAVLKGVEGIVKAVLERWPDRKAISFWPKTRSARVAYERFNHYRPGIAGYIDAKTPRDERREVIAQCRAGDIQILCNVMIATEGFDWPEASLIINCRPTKSRGLYTQILGRGTRVLANTVDHIPGADNAGERRTTIANSDKPKCVIADFVGNAGKHNLCSPIDVLAGSYSELEVKKAKKLAKAEGAGDPIDQLERARLEIAAMAASIPDSKVKHSARRFNPFATLGIAEIPNAWKDVDGITDRQAGVLLREYGFKPDEMRKLSKNEAKGLIVKLDSQKQRGLASFAQLKQLQRFGVHQKDITQARAGDAMSYLQKNGWGHGKGFDRARFQALATGLSVK